MSVSKDEFLLAGDIGGTKTNLALYTPDAYRPEQTELVSFTSADHDSLEDIIDRFLRDRKVMVTAACFGIAGPVTGGKVKTTNLQWEISEDAIAKRFQFSRVSLINDLAATALSIPTLREDEIEIINRATPMDEAPIGLLAPGTGLGISLVFRKGGIFSPIDSEGGHVDFAPINAEQFDLLEFFSKIYGHVSIERIVSGPGIFDIYRWLRSNDPQREAPRVAERLAKEDPPKVITDSALSENDPLSLEAVNMFISIFGQCAGNLALTGFTRGGIYLGGGISPKALPMLKSAQFLESYWDKGRFKPVLQSIPVWVILNDQAALIGAANYAMKSLETGKYR